MKQMIYDSEELEEKIEAVCTSLHNALKKKEVPYAVQYFSFNALICTIAISMGITKEEVLDHVSRIYDHTKKFE